MEEKTGGAISHAEYLQLVGLLALARRHDEQPCDIEGAVGLEDGRP